jgi:type IV fimbrial biogenesis protein FimT
MNAVGYPQRGVTLIELLFAIAILAILLGIGAPSFMTLIRDNRVTTSNNDLVSSFAIARNESSHRGLPVAVCASADAESCSGEADWATGWIVFVDDDTGTAGEVDEEDEILQTTPALPENFTLQASEPFVRFFPNGLTTPAGEKAFALQDGEHTDHVRCVTVSAIGRVATAREICE